MRHYTMGLFLVFAVLFAAGPASSQGSAQTQQVADKVISQLLQVQPGSVVLIFGNAEHIDLTEDLAVSASAVGASPAMTIASNRVNRLYFQRTPARFDSLPPKAGLRLLSIADEIVFIDRAFDPSVTASAPASRLAALAKAGNAFTDESNKRGIPTISIGNGILPSAVTAKQFGVSEAALSALFWSGLNTDYPQLHRNVAAVAAAIKGAQVHITAPNGTDLTFIARSAPAELNDGMVSVADRSRGGPAVQKQLPAGDVYYLARPGTAKGTVVFEDTRINGVLVSGLTAHFVGGLMTSHSAKSGLQEFDRLYAASGAGRDQFGFFDVGTNRSMRVPAAGQWGPGPSMAAGYVTIGIGNDLFFGGSDASAFAFGSGVPNATITANGTKLVTSGALRT